MTAPPPAGYILLYDGRCPMCTTIVRWLQRAGMLASGIRVLPWPNDELHDEHLAERLRSEVVLYHQPSGQMTGGLAGLCQLLELEGRLAWLTWLCRLPAVSSMAGGLYRLVSLNRRMLSPPSPAEPETACPCEPPFDRMARLTMIALLLAVAGGGAGLLGLVLGGLTPDRDGWFLTRTVLIGQGTGWLTSLAGLWPTLGKRFPAFAVQTVVAMTISGVGLALAALMLAGGMLLKSPPHILLWLLAGGILLERLMTFRSIFCRSRTLALPRWTPWLWLLWFTAGWGLAWQSYGWKVLQP